MSKRKKRVARHISRDPNFGTKYSRVSTKDQEKEGYSIPAQIKLLNEYGSRENITSLAEFVDVETAKHSGRSAFHEMVEYLKRNKRVGSILVEKTDRLYRNLKDYLTIDELGVEIHFVKEGVVISESSRSSEKFMHGIRVLMAKQYVDNLSEEVRKGQAEKASQGYWPTKAPFGYLNAVGPEGKRVIVPDPENGHIVQKIFRWYLYEELTLDDLVNKLRDSGFTKNGGPFCKTSVSYILRNIIYTGDFYWCGKLHVGVHEPLISRDEWSRVQEKMDGRKNTKSPGKLPFAFSNLITCAACGSSVVAEIKKGKYVYYHLSAYRDQCIGQPKACKKDWVKEERLEAYFNELLAKLEFDEEVLLWLREALLASSSEKRTERQQAIKRLQGEVSRLDDRLEKLYVDKLDGSVHPEFFASLSAKWRGESEYCRRQIEALALEEKAYFEEGIQIVNFVRNAHKLFEKQSPSEKRRLLNFVLSNCEWEHGKLRASFRQPFDFLVKAVGQADGDKLLKRKKRGPSEIWLGRQDSNLGMAVPKTAALPLGDAPKRDRPESGRSRPYIQCRRKAQSRRDHF
jgi:site-specific DNA recombinase